MTVLSISSEQYHADELGDRPSLSATIAKILIAQSPRHAFEQHPRLNPNYQRKTEDKFDVGTVAHQVLLEGKNSVGIVYADDWRTKDAKAMRDQIREEGRIPLLDKQWFEVEAMCAAVREQLPLLDVQPALFEDGKPERTIVWEEDGVLCRALIDWLHDDASAVDDLKTTSRSANPETWTKTMYGIGADIQVAMHKRAVKAATGIDPDFRFLVAETEPPYAVSVVSLAPSALVHANDKVEYALALWKRCLKTGIWPGYDRRVHSVETPSYLEYAWLEKEAREAA